MSGSLEQLAQRLAAAEMDVAGASLGELVERGPAAIPTLVAALASPNAQVRGLAAEGLGMIGETSVADAVAAAVDDRDDRVRAKAAVALIRLGDSRGADAAIQTINDFPDLLHSELSLSAYALAALGVSVAPRVAALLLSEDAAKRQKGAWVLRQIAAQQVDAIPRWQELHRLLRAYDPDGSPSDRAAISDMVAAFFADQTDDLRSSS